MSHIVMLLSNPFRPDPRVLKEVVSLAERDHQVTILCWDRAAELQAEEHLDNGVVVMRIQGVPSSYGVGTRQLLSLPRFWLALQSLLKRLQPDLVHCHDFDTLPAGLWWGRLHHIPVVYDAHEYYADLCRPRLHGASGELLYRLIRFAEHNGARLASAVITVDELLGNIYRRYNQRVIIVGHYPPRQMVPQPAIVFQGNELILLYVGRLSVDRGLLLYADLLRSLLQRNIPARLRLAGSFTLAEDEQLFRQRAAGLEATIDTIGWIPFDQVPEILTGGDVGLAVLLPEPRYVAALPVKLFEYMAAGLPVLASNFPQIANVLSGRGTEQSKSYGAVVDPSDLTAAVAILTEWWQHPEIPRSLGASGRQAVLERFNWESLVEQVDDLYRSLLQG